jgi:hypothetical protein
MKSENSSHPNVSISKSPDMLIGNRSIITNNNSGEIQNYEITPDLSEKRLKRLRE